MGAEANEVIAGQRSHRLAVCPVGSSRGAEVLGYAATSQLFTMRVKEQG